MYSLTEVQLEKIREEVNQQNIHVGHLQNDMIDHLACEIESRIWSGASFEIAFKEVMKEIGSESMQNIQKETLYLIDKNYRIMKNLMKWVGVGSMAIITFGTMFKITHTPGADIMITAGFILLGLVFFPAALIVIRKESKHTQLQWLYLAAALGGILLMMGILLKLEHWPFSIYMMTIGYLLLNCLFLPIMLYSLLSITQEKNMRWIYIIGAVSIFFASIGFIFKLNHLPGALIFLLLGSVGLTSIFLPAYTYRLFKDKDRLQTSYIFLCTGILYFALFNLLLAVN